MRPHTLEIRIGMRHSLVGLIALTAMVASLATARAADLYQAPPVRPAPQVAAVPFSWAGVYLGINGGYGWGRSNWSDPATDPTLRRFGLSGGVAGGQVGYNWQTGAFVLGLESDLDWTNLSGSRSDGGVCAANGGGQCQTSQSWLGTTRGRVGYAFGSWLPYVTGGAAYGDINLDQPGGSDATTRLGWTAGAGVEYSLSRHWSAKLEFLHLDLGTATFMGAATSTPISTPAKDDIVRAGINYHW
jgi:outer membrane immunogenic protein